MSENIYQRINAIQQAVGYVKKDASVGYGNNAYKAVTHDAVLSVLREEFINKKVIVVPQQRSLGETLITGTTEKGKSWVLFRALYDIQYVCADNPSDFLTVSVEGHGEDMNDKADGKALSYACKMANLKLLLLATGINDEERLEEKPKKEYVNKHEDSGPEQKKTFDAVLASLRAADTMEEIDRVAKKAESIWNKWPSAWINAINAEVTKREKALQ